MTLLNGIYRTAAGSNLEVSGPHGGIFRLDFDWFEETGACIDCEADPEPREFGPGDFRITWSCVGHDAGNAKLFPQTPATNSMTQGLTQS